MRTVSRASFFPLWLSTLSVVVCAAPALAQGPALTLSNRTMTVHLSALPGAPELQVEDLPAHRTLNIPQLFSITMRDGSKLEPAGLHWTQPFARTGSDICAGLQNESLDAHFHWCLSTRPAGHYMREHLTIEAGARDLPIAQVQLLAFQDPQAHVLGTVKGSPLADDAMFFGFEHPISWSRVTSGLVQAGISRELPLRAHQSVTYSAVIGTYEPGQLRRAFLAYIEAERPRPYKPFLNYNTWYDIGYENRFTEAEALDRIHAFGTELVDKRHVQMDSFVFDDGWDNPATFWNFNPGFPDGFTRVSQAAAAYHAGIGVWLSPWGGYAEQKQERIAYGRAHGYEIVKDGFALSGPKYFQGFSQRCFEMMQRYDVNIFKFDGTGNADRVFPGSVFDSDFDAAIHLIHDIRAKKPGIFINLTTGTYPSPFWLFYADSTWRGGDDHSFDGVGTSRQRWITYRDEQTWRNIVQGGPLFPLNSLMLHGMIYAKQAQDLGADPHNDFPDEVLSYFGSGTQLQEMYVTPALLSQADWDILARAATWSREHAAILEDTHWIGGDPGKLRVYGWAAWNPEGWIVTLRNPSDHPQTFQFTLKQALQLPVSSSRRPNTAFVVQQPFAKQPSSPLQWQANNPVSVQLQPFEVRIYESSAR